jgi:hypothetical protein
MKQLALTAIVTAGMLAAGACERQAGPQASPNAQTPPASAARPAPGAPPPGEAAARTPTPQAGQAAAQTAFDTADQNKDGKVDSAEASAVPGLDFAAADANRDASLSRPEYLAAIALGSRPPG